MRKDDPAAAVEAAMVAIRRRQSRRTLAREAGVAPSDDATQQVLDAVEAAAEPLGVTAVAAALDVDQPRASKLVAAAVDAGLLRRVADQDDGRRSHLALTPSGRERLDAVHSARQARFGAAMADWTAAERETFAALLTRFVTALG